MEVSGKKKTRRTSRQLHGEHDSSKYILLIHIYIEGIIRPNRRGDEEERSYVNDEYEVCCCITLRSI